MQFHFDPTDYSRYKEEDFRYRWLRPQKLKEKLEKFGASLKLTSIGLSEEGREINRLNFGDGPVKVMLWSQMHGNEPTATMAMVDLFNFLGGSDKYDPVRSFIKDRLNLLFIPMLNPDGGEKFTRRNALGLDLNRDARRNCGVEMQVFKKQFEDFKPQFAFNLHDQRNIFSVEGTRNPATMSLLAPSVSERQEINDTRLRSMQIIAGMSEIVEELNPGHYARYTAEYYPRSLGEYCQGRGVSTILIESGAHFDDPFRDHARKLNFLVLLKAFVMIASESYLEYELHQYEQIPANEQRMMDIIVRDCSIELPQRTITTDIGLMMKEKADSKSNGLKHYYTVADLGDLDFHYGLQEFKGGKISGSPVPEQAADFTLELSDRKLIFKKGELHEEY